MSIKPRGVDFDLFHQSAEAENTYGPFHTKDLRDAKPALRLGRQESPHLGRLAGHERGQEKPSEDLVLRLDIYVGERDSFGIGFSDNVIFHRQLFVRAVLGDPSPAGAARGRTFDAADAASAVGIGNGADGDRLEVRRRGSGLRRHVRNRGLQVPQTGDPVPLGKV